MLMTFNQVGLCQKRKGFYHAWQRLVKHDPLFTKQRLTLAHLPNQATEAIEYAFQELE